MANLRSVVVAGAAFAAFVAIVGAAGATTYNAASAFSSSNPSGPWSYGYGATGASFTPYTSYQTDEFGITGLDGYSLYGAGEGPAILKNEGVAAVSFANTVVLPTGLLLLQPGDSDGEDAIIRFTAPTTGVYALSGFFETLDTNPTGVTLIAADSGGILGSWNFLGSPAALPATPGGKFELYDDIYFQLIQAGQWIELGVQYDGLYPRDATGLSLVIAAVPEPAAWALMLVGFAGLGAALRAARRGGAGA